MTSDEERACYERIAKWYNETGWILDTYLVANAIRALPLTTESAAQDAADQQCGIQELMQAVECLLSESEEFQFDDGLGRGAQQQYWDDVEKVMERLRESVFVRR